MIWRQFDQGLSSLHSVEMCVFREAARTPTDRVGGVPPCGRQGVGPLAISAVTPNTGALSGDEVVRYPVARSPLTPLPDS